MKQESVKIEDKGGRRANHKTSTSLTVDSKKNGAQASGSKSEHKSQRKMTSVFSALKTEADQGQNMNRNQSLVK